MSMHPDEETILAVAEIVRDCAAMNDAALARQAARSVSASESSISWSIQRSTVRESHATVCSPILMGAGKCSESIQR